MKSLKDKNVPVLSLVSVGQCNEACMSSHWAHREVLHRLKLGKYKMLLKR